MAIVRVFGRPTFFVTFTCNVNWPEIRTALLPGQDAQSRPDLVARVFHLKLKALLQELTPDGIPGRCVAMMSVVEFQKRGKQGPVCFGNHRTKWVYVIYPTIYVCVLFLEM